jgi:uncharacterized protein
VSPPELAGPNEALGIRTPANRVSPRAVRYWFLRALLRWLVLLAAVEAALVFAFDQPLRVSGTTGLAIAVAGGAHLAVMPRFRYRIHRWELGGVAVATRTGWLNQETRIAPLSRVQTVDTERGPLQRLLGLAKVTVTTASARGPLVIDGLGWSEAAILVAALGDAAGAARDDAT